MYVFVTSVPDELTPCRVAAVEIVRGLGHEPMLHDPSPRRAVDPVTACRRQVARADVVLAVVGRRRGEVPPATDGGDDLRPWSWWQVAAAFAHGVPVVALVSGDGFAPGLVEEDAEARAMMADFRGGLARVASTFDDVASFRRLVAMRLRGAERASGVRQASFGGLALRRFPPPVLPAQPYPLLLPYHHPALLAGRDDDLAELRRLLARPVTVVALHAASGMGKPLLAGGLVPALRAEGRPVAFDRHPAEPGLAGRLLGDLVVAEQGHDAGGPDAGGPDAGGRDGAPGEATAPAAASRPAGAGGVPEAVLDADVLAPTAFVDLLVSVRRLAGGVPPVLVVDQLEDLLADDADAAGIPGAETARALLGPLLAASAQHLPGLDGPPCRWLLAYRQEVHGKVVAWLEDVLRDARRHRRPGIETLPHDLSGPSRFVDGPLRPLATPPPGSDDPAGDAAGVFREVIERPLRIGRYPWTFAPGHAARLARAFGEARVRRPASPLVPELQVVLAHLLEAAGEPVGEETAVVEVPEEPAELIDRALEEHLRRSLDLAFPRSMDDDGRTARTRALLVLRELADAHGRREEGREADALARALGEEGRGILDRLSTARTRLVIREQHGDAQVYVLSHDRLAEVLVRAVDEGRPAGLGIDAELLSLRRFVALQSQLFASGDVAQATALTSGQRRRIAAHRDVLLWNDQHRAWWRACRERRRIEARRRLVRRALAAVVVAAVALIAWTLAEHRVRRQALLTDVATGEPESALAALAALEGDGHDPASLRARLAERAVPFDVFERGLGGVAPEARPAALLRAAGLALPLLADAPEDPVSIASLVWALDFHVASGREPAAPDLLARAAELRRAALAPLRARRPPPPRPGPGDPGWAAIPEGAFWMGASPVESRDEPNMVHERPRHPVIVGAFRLQRTEVTNAEYRRLVPAHPGPDEHPAVGINWYQAYLYAAWLGGRLPTEAEWEYAARAGCPHAFCGPQGGEASLDEVGWWVGNAVDPATREPALQPVGRLAANPWGLWDVFGNAWEWTASWYGPYPAELQKDPIGPIVTADAAKARRVYRGGSVSMARRWTSASLRQAQTPRFAYREIGFRVAMPAPDAR